MQATDDHAENVLFREMVHKRIPVNHGLSDLDNIDVMVPEREPIPNEIAFRTIISLTIAVLVDHVLDSVNFLPAMIGAHNYVFTFVALGRSHNRDLRNCSLVVLLFFGHAGRRFFRFNHAARVDHGVGAEGSNVREIDFFTAFGWWRIIGWSHVKRLLHLLCS